MAREPKVSYAAIVDPLIALAYRELATPALMSHLDALRAECERIFFLKQAKAEAGDVYLKEADAVATLSDHYCEVFAYAEERLGIGRTIARFDITKPHERQAALSLNNVTPQSNTVVSFRKDLLDTL